MKEARPPCTRTKGTYMKRSQSFLPSLTNATFQHQSCRSLHLAPVSFLIRTKRRRQQLPPPNQALLDAATGRRDSPIAPAHGGAGDTATSAVPATTGQGNATGQTRAGVGVGRPTGSGKGGGRTSRVARLGSALDDVETRANGAKGTGGRAARARSGEKVLCYVGCCALPHENGALCF